MASGLAAALIGGSAGVVTALASSTIAGMGQRWQVRHQSEDAREQRREATRRDAYADMVKAYSEYRAAWWALQHELSNSADIQRCDELFARILKVWREFEVTYSLVQVVGPNEVADEAQQLRKDALAYDQAGVAWYEAVKAGASTRTVSKYVDEYNAAWNAAGVGKFASAARDALDHPRATAVPKRRNLPPMTPDQPI